MIACRATDPATADAQLVGRSVRSEVQWSASAIASLFALALVVAHPGSARGGAPKRLDLIDASPGRLLAAIVPRSGEPTTFR